MNTSRRWMNLMRFSLNVAVSLQTIWIRSERTPFSNGGHSTTRNRSKLAQKGSAKPFMRKAYDMAPAKRKSRRRVSPPVAFCSIISSDGGDFLADAPVHRQCADFFGIDVAPCGLVREHGAEELVVQRVARPA